MAPKAARMDTKVCTRCFAEKRIEEFRRVWKDRPERHARCRECHNLALRERRQKERRRQFKSFHSAFKLGRTTPAAQEAVVRKMLARFGGVDGLVDVWARELLAAMEEQPGSPFVLDAMFAITVMMANAHDEHAQRVREMTDEQLDEQLEKEIRRVVGQRWGGGHDGSAGAGGGESEPEPESVA